MAECSDGSILFRFGYASEIAGSVELEEAEGLTDVEIASKCEESEIGEESKLFGRDDGVAHEEFSGTRRNEKDSLPDSEHGGGSGEMISDVGLCNQENDGNVVEAVNNSGIGLEDEIVLCKESDNNAVEDGIDGRNGLEDGTALGKERVGITKSENIAVEGGNYGRNGLKDEIALFKDHGNVPESANNVVGDENDGRNGLEDEITLCREHGDVSKGDINVVETVNDSEIGPDDEVHREHFADIENDTIVVDAIVDSNIGFEERPSEEGGLEILSSDSFGHVVRLESEATADSEKTAVEQDKGQILKPVGVSELDSGFNIENNSPEEDFEGHVENEVSTPAVVLESEFGPDLETDCGSEETSEEKSEGEPMVLLACSDPHSVIEVVNNHESSENQVEILKIKDIHVSTDVDAEASHATDEVVHGSNMIKVGSVCAVVGPEPVLDEETSHGSVEESAETHGTKDSIPVCTISLLTIHFEC